MNIIIYIIGVLVALYLISRLFNNQPKGYENLSVNELKALMNDKKVQLIDVRTKSEMQAGKIGKPLWIELDNNFSSKASQLDKENTYVVYCRSGRRSAIASKMLANLGFKKVYNLSGGYMSYA